MDVDIICGGKGKDISDLIDTAFSLINDLVTTEPMSFIQPYFHEYIVDEVTELLLLGFKEVLSTAKANEVEDLLDDIDICIEEAMELFYKKVAPKRAFDSTFIRSPPIISDISEIITYLRNVPQPDQRTTEWYNFRYKYLTASSIWKAFISESTRNQLIYDKCKPLNLEKYNHTSTDSPMHWGHKYEPVSIQIYELLYKTGVSDFGCIPHSYLLFLAASPDGINTLEKSERYGRMLEVKNIVNREIDGRPKMEYWIQMQVQMEVCNLNECDFLETRFKEYEDEEAFLEDSYSEYAYFDNERNINKTKDGRQKGMMIMFIVNEKPHYEYCPLNSSKKEMGLWEETMLQKHDNDMWVKNIYWRLDELSCVLVLRNKLWFNAAIPILTELWKTIEHEKQNGYEHRSPKKRVKVNKSDKSDAGSIGSTFCNFDMNDIEMFNSCE